MSDYTESPWTKISTNVFELDIKTYIIAVDYLTTKFFQYSESPRQSPMVIMHLKSMFEKFGIPQTVISDNGSEFKSKDFKNIC